MTNSETVADSPTIHRSPTGRVASFRDPAGRVVFVGERCFRAITKQGSRLIDEFLTTPAAQRWMDQRKLISTKEPDSIPDELLNLLGVAQLPDKAWARVVEHEPVEFANYPHEWPAEMLESAARLTLEIAAAVLPCGFNLKDASPWNIMFRGPEPVFLDLLSFERRDERGRVWMAYGQFARTFLFPLLLWRARRIPPAHHFISTRDGIKPIKCFQWLGFWRAAKPPALGLCAIPAAFDWWAMRRKKRTAAINPARARSSAEALFVISRLIRRLERALDQITIRGAPRSEWTDYTDEVARREFASGYFESKKRFVSKVLDSVRPASCLDIGCNTGYFSFMAAGVGARVVAIDRDEATVGRIFRKARAERQSVLPLLVDFARPTPGVGWNNDENLSFLDRATSARFDLVMILALVHHLCLVERVPLSEVASLASRLAPRRLLVEFVPREDPLAQQMPGIWIGDSDWSGYDRQTFEEAFGIYFRTLRATELTGSNRWIYLMERRASQ